jgi:hypothetical protein
MAVPPPVLNAFYRALLCPERLRLLMVPALLHSAWLTWIAFMASAGMGAL